jgi:hypothetical protein
MNLLLTAGLGAFVLAWFAEQAVLRVWPPRPSPGVLAARLAIFAWLYLFWVAVWGEPWRGAFAALLNVIVMAGISVGKRSILGEPLSFSDFGLVPLIVRFPRLYLLEGGRLVAFWAVVLGCVLLLLFTQPAHPVFGPGARVGVLLTTAMALAILPRLTARKPVSAWLRARVPNPDPDGAIDRWGVVMTCLVGWLRWSGDVARPYPEPTFTRDEDEAPVDPEIVVVVQLESFLDPVRAGFSDVPLPEFARLRNVALMHGPLSVPAYGAFTMRTEHAVLTGLPDAALGFRRLDPYLGSSGPRPQTLASRLADRGWRTVFMHPFPARFFNRRRVVPRLGFHDLQFEERFADCRRIGPYVSDVDFAGSIVGEAERASGRTLIMAVTMENHGPFSPHRGIGLAEDREQHSFHLRNTDAALGVLLDGLARLDRRVLLCVYGDHPPILKAFPAGKPPETDYAVVLLGGGPTVARLPERRMSADGLGRVLLRLCGLAGDDPPVARHPEKTGAG